MCYKFLSKVEVDGELFEVHNISRKSFHHVPVAAYTGDAEMKFLLIGFELPNKVSRGFVSIFWQKCHEQAWYANHFLGALCNLDATTMAYAQVFAPHHEWAIRKAYFRSIWQATSESHMHFLSQIFFSPFVVIFLLYNNESISSIGGTCPPWDYTILYTDKVAERDLMPAFEITFPDHETD
ncbi:hypothetical protein ACJX0J_035187 [Zea mays]